MRVAARSECKHVVRREQPQDAIQCVGVRSSAARQLGGRRRLVLQRVRYTELGDHMKASRKRMGVDQISDELNRLSIHHGALRPEPQSSFERGAAIEPPDAFDEELYFTGVVAGLPFSMK